MTRALDRSPGGESFRRITDALTLLSGPGRRSGKWVKFRCPTHDDTNPSLGVTYDAAKGRTQLRCFGSCDDTTVLAALTHLTTWRKVEPRANSTARLTCTPR